MPYPPRYIASHDFALDEQNGVEPSGTKLSVELANTAETLNQIIGFIRAGFTSDKKWQPAGALGQKISDRESFTAGAGQDTFTLVTEIGAAGHVRVFTDGLLYSPSQVTIAGQNVVLDAGVPAGTEVVIEVFNDYEAFQTELASIMADAGASLVGIHDALGQYSAANVEDALAEVMAQFNGLVTALGNLSLYGLIDGSRAWQADQSMGGNRLTDLANGTDPQDAVTVNQLQILADIYGDLSNVFLSLAGGIMSGALDMGDNRIRNVESAVQPGDATNLAQLDALQANIGANFLRLTGGTMSGKLSVIPAVDGDSPVRLDQIEAIVAGELDNAALGFVGGLATNKSAEPLPDLSLPGVYDFDNLTISNNDTPFAYASAIRVAGDADLSGRTLEVSFWDSLTEIVQGALRPVARGDDVEIVQASAIATRPNTAGGAGGNGVYDGLSVSVSQGHVRRGLVGPFSVNTSQWARPGFILGGRGNDRGSATELTLRGGGGCLKLLVDGDLDIEGLELNASGQNLTFPADYRRGGGGGSIMIVCRGTVHCGAGAALIARGGNGSGGGGGGYVAVVARRIEGILNVDVRGGDSGGSNARGNGGYAELLRAEVEAGDTINSLVAQGSGSLSNSSTQDGEEIRGRIEASRIPFAGGLI